MSTVASQWVMYSARTLGLIWVAFWIWFGLGSGIVEGLKPGGVPLPLPLPWYVLVHTAVPGLIFLVLFLIAWRWELIGGVLLVAVGAVVAVAYPLMFAERLPLAMIIPTEVSLAGPPLVAGVLFLIHARA